jgi:hypothetical protein
MKRQSSYQEGNLSHTLTILTLRTSEILWALANIEREAVTSILTWWFANSCNKHISSYFLVAHIKAFINQPDSVQEPLLLKI